MERGVQFPSDTNIYTGKITLPLVCIGKKEIRLKWHMHNFVGIYLRHHTFYMINFFQIKKKKLCLNLYYT